MKTVRTLAVLVMVATVLAAIMGSYVRGMGAGLACPDWPLCHGRLIPPLDQQAVVLEWTHRMIVFVMGWLVLALLAITWRSRLQGRYLATVAFIFLLGQAILGGMTVLNRLHPMIVALHQGMALVFFGSVVALAIQEFRAVDTPSQAAPASKG